jgi:hypothetical protein
MPRYSLAPLRPDYPAAVSVAHFVSGALSGAGALAPPLALRLLARFPFHQRLPARLIGIGVRPEHVASSAAG